MENKRKVKHYVFDDFGGPMDFIVGGRIDLINEFSKWFPIWVFWVVSQGELCRLINYS